MRALRRGFRAVVVSAMFSAACASALPPSTFKPSDEKFEPILPPETIAPNELHDVVVVGNNWAGTATIFDPHTYKIIGTLNVVPDYHERMGVIAKDSDRVRTVGLVYRFAGENNHQLVDDLFLSKDGRRLFVSRPSLGDVAAFSLQTGERLWRTDVEGFRADHAALSPDGNLLLVSATRARKVHAIETDEGKIIGGFPSGDEPHENIFSDDGKRIYHASIGRVFLPVRSRLFKRLKGDRWLQVIDAKSITGKCLLPGKKNCDIKKCTEKAADGSRCIDMRAELEEFGRNGAESAVRPMAVTDDERFVYAQISFLHGFVEYDLTLGKITRIAELPASPEVKEFSAREHQLNSAHHGIALNHDDSRLCVAGTVSGYAAIVQRDTFASTIIPLGKKPLGGKPYWATQSAKSVNKDECYVSVSEDDRVAVISFDEQKEIRTIEVGRHPQRVRAGKMLLNVDKSASR